MTLESHNRRLISVEEQLEVLQQRHFQLEDKVDNLFKTVNSFCCKHTDDNLPNYDIALVDLRNDLKILKNSITQARHDYKSMQNQMERTKDCLHDVIERLMVQFAETSNKEQISKILDDIKIIKEKLALR